MENKDRLPAAASERQKTCYLYIGPPFNIGRTIAEGDDIPIAMCDHVAAAPRKSYKMTLGKAGISFMGMMAKLRPRML